MSLGQAQEIYEIMQKIDAILNGITIKMDTVKEKTKETGTTLSEAVNLTWRLSHLVAHLTGSDDLNNYINKLTKAIFMTRLLVTAMHMMEMGTPYGMVMGVVGVASMALPAWVEGY